MFRLAGCGPVFSQKIAERLSDQCGIVNSFESDFKRFGAKERTGPKEHEQFFGGDKNVQNTDYNCGYMSTDIC